MKESERTAICILIAICCIVLIMMSLWLIDISVTAIIAESLSISGQKAVMTNGFFTTTPMKMYHIGLYGIVIFSTILTMLVVYVWTRQS